ncbi:unnamed protein product, partial [Bubo scandiacus]
YSSIITPIPREMIPTFYEPVNGVLCKNHSTSCILPGPGFEGRLPEKKPRHSA